MPPESLCAVTLGTCILVRPAYANDVRTLREEMIHVKQQAAGQASNEVVEGEIAARLQMVGNRLKWGITNDQVRAIIKETIASGESSPQRQVLGERTTKLEDPNSGRRAGWLAWPAFGAAASAIALCFGGLTYLVLNRRDSNGEAAKSAAVAPSTPSAAAAPPPSVAPAAAPPPSAAAPAAAPPTSASPTVVAEPSEPQKREKGKEGRRRRALIVEGTGILRIAKESSPVRVEVDGTYVGSAPLDFKVEPGEHRVTLVRATGPVTVPVNVAAGRSYEINRGGAKP